MAERRPPAPARLVSGVLALLLPMLGLVLLLTRPELDVSWEHHPAHFWVVFATAAVAAGLAYVTGDAAIRRGDARVLQVSLTFLASAGFLALHALATPGMLLGTANLGFQLATPVGIAVGAVFVVLSCRDVPGERAQVEVRRGRAMRVALLVAMAVWGAWSLVGLPPLDRPPTADDLATDLLALVAIVLYLLGAARYVQLWLRRPAVVLLAMLSAFVLLAEAMVAIALADNWHLAWWEWHLLLLAAFVLVALGARASWHEERFADLYLPATTSGTRVISVLFADLQGFTTYSEGHEPEEVTAMLNAYFAATVPAVVDPHGGDVDRIVGDALMVTFNKRGDQRDHPRRAAAAGLALQAAAARVHAEHPDWPRFRVGINTGPVAVSLLGTAGGRTHTVIGDVVNTASRIEGRAPVGGVAVGSATKALLPGATTVPLGDLELKGKSGAVPVHLLVALDERPDPAR
ncbi:adenylate/guanylate cyclase domain-containing protein [Nocardioides sp. YIM 152315]|uniref:adenylate/guanylate cyclase domain-containing protein n=1 Tax=Nocardioides sp. YIM 152315 TaxID=3031760 RepID=UPI0023DB9A71|nr:adenylate/guanylate cyclase domain-containing protein [Nocardioides sp. YIM 152315]MDF1601923.1 adenylate/guanylate cyclase domain-containing protein [Nocardioides sp. YIM 152315]